MSIPGYVWGGRWGSRSGVRHTSGELNISGEHTGKEALSENFEPMGKYLSHSVKVWNSSAFTLCQKRYPRVTLEKRSRKEISGYELRFQSHVWITVKSMEKYLGSLHGMYSTQQINVI